MHTFNYIKVYKTLNLKRKIFPPSSNSLPFNNLNLQQTFPVGMPLFKKKFLRISCSLQKKIK